MANPLFMQATMELISRGEYISWKLPKNTNIILTSNPDNENYIVSSLDAAMESRFVSFHLDFDINPWSKWADSVNLRSELINFALFNPEIFSRSLRINARSYSLFANCCKSLKDLESKQSLEMINLIAKGCFGEDGDYIGGLIVQFVNNKLDKLMSAHDILSGNWDTISKKIYNTIYQNNMYRADIASVLTTRLVNYIENEKSLNTDNVIKRIDEILNHSEVLFTEDLLLILIKKMVSNRKYTIKMQKLLLNDKIRNKILD